MRENMSEEKKCSNCMEQKLRQEVREILEQYTTSKDNLIQILNEIQEKYGYIPKEAQLEISDYLKIPMAEIYGVITFYSRFTLKPKGKYNVSVCLGTACFVKGSQAILDRLKSRLNIQEGETTKDGKFSIDATRCVGACGLAPVFTVNDEVYGKATVKKLDEVLDEYMKKE
ncbi:MAG: NADH-quinone oxidoreductase subunit NuoE [Clostridia bacterium]